MLRRLHTAGEDFALDKSWGTFFEEMRASDLVQVDRAGLVVFQDAVQKIYGLNKGTTAMVQPFVRDLEAMILGRKNHPCIVQFTLLYLSKGAPDTLVPWPRIHTQRPALPSLQCLQRPLTASGYRCA